MRGAGYGGHLERLAALAAPAAGRWYAAGGFRDAPGVSTSALRIFPRVRGEAESAVELPVAITALAVLADELIVAAGTDGVLHLVTLESAGPALAGAHPAHSGAVRALAADALGRRLASAGADGLLKVFEVQTVDGAPRLALVASAAGGAVVSVALDAAGALAAAGGEDGALTLLPVGAPAPRRVPLAEAALTALCFLPDGRLAFGTGAGTLGYAYTEGAPEVEERSGDLAHTGAVRALILGPAGRDPADQELPRRLFSAGEDGLLRVWPLESRRKPRTLSLELGPLTALCHVPSPKRARPEQRGGTVAAASAHRRLALVPLDAAGEPGDEVERLESELERLAAQLGGGSPAARKEALEALARVPEDEARQLTEGLLGDKKPELAARAAELLAERGRKRSRPALRAALTAGHPEVRRAVFAALLALDRDAPLTALRAGLEASTEDLRLLALERLPLLGAGSPALPALAAAHLADAARAVRMKALEVSLDAAPGRLDGVRTALARGAPDVRAEALLRLGFSGAARAGPGRALVEAALDDADAEVRGTAFLVAVAGVGPLVRELKTRDDRTAQALAQLEKRGPITAGSHAPLAEADKEVLFAALSARRADTALRGARALAVLGDRRAVGALLQLSREAEAEVRRWVVSALLAAARALPDAPELAERLDWLLDDADAEVRAAAFEALGQLAGQDEDRWRLAESGLRAAFPDIRQRALRLVLKERGARAEALVADALDDEAPDVRQEAYRTLWSWHGPTPRVPLERAAACRHADLRSQVTAELQRRKEPWARTALLAMVSDTSHQVGLQAYAALTSTEAERRRAAVHLAAMASPRPEVRARGVAGATEAPAADVKPRLRQLVADEHPAVHLAAIEAIDRLGGWDEVAFKQAFASLFPELRVRAGELCGQRRDRRAADPLRELLLIPKTDLTRPAEELRARAARALADLGDPPLVPFYAALLDDENPLVREMGARGLATAARLDGEQPLLAALSHPDLPVRSWAAEGLARLGDRRALPVLAGTQRHSHRPIRQGALLGFVALGADGLQGILQGLSDPDRELQDLMFAVVAARDRALLLHGLGPDLLLAALSAAHPEIRYAAARSLEARLSGDTALALRLIGPAEPEKAAELARWPAEARRAGWLEVLVQRLASDDPEDRYAAAQVLALRAQPEAFWREAERLAGPALSSPARAPHTNFADERRQTRKKDWIRRLYSRPEASGARALGTTRVLQVIHLAGGPRPRPVPSASGRARLLELLFGAYAGLVRQAPPKGDADETHRVRRDAVERLAALSAEPCLGRAAALAVLRRALSDPHHLVRRAAYGALVGLYPEGAAEPQALALESDSEDVGRRAVDVLVERAAAGDAAAREAVKGALDAGHARVRAHALGRLVSLYPPGSMEPWLLGLDSRYPDVRREVLERLSGADDPRVLAALLRAAESDDQALRLRAGAALAGRGEARAVDVLAPFLRSDDQAAAGQALEALISLAHAAARKRGTPPVPSITSAAAAQAIVARLTDDPEATADRAALVEALGRVGDPVAERALVELAASTEERDRALRSPALEAWLAITRDPARPERALAEGDRRPRYQDELCLRGLAALARAGDGRVRLRVAEALRDVHHAGAEALLVALAADRDPEIRVAACTSLADRATHVAGASVEPLSALLRQGRRELVLPTAEGLAEQRRPEAFQALLLVLRAGEPAEKARAVLALGSLGDRRGLEPLLELVAHGRALDDDDRALLPEVAEALGRMLPRLVGEELVQARAAVTRLATEAEVALRLRAITGLRRAGDDASRALIARLAVDRAEGLAVRRHAALELGRTGHAEAEPVLAGLLSASDFALRQAALESLERLLPTAPTRVQLHALGSSYADVSEPAATFLAQQGDAGELLARLSQVESPAVRRRLRQGLLRRGAAPRSALEPLLLSDRPGNRETAAWLAGASGASELRAPLAEALARARRDYHEARRAHRPAAELEPLAAAWALGLWAGGRVGLEPSGDLWGALEADAPPAVRRAGAALVARTPRAIQAAPLLDDLEPAVRRAAGAALGALAPAEARRTLAAHAGAGAEAVGPLLRAALADGAGAVLGDPAARALGAPLLAGEHRHAALRGVALDAALGDAPARLQAVAALGRAGGAEAAAALELILQDRAAPVTVRAAAFRALKRAQRAATPRWTEGQDQERGRWASSSAQAGGAADWDDATGEDAGEDGDPDNDWSGVMPDDEGAEGEDDLDDADLDQDEDEEEAGDDAQDDEDDVQDDEDDEEAGDDD